MDIRKIIREELKRIMTPSDIQKEEVFLNMDDYDIVHNGEVIGRIFAFIKNDKNLINLSEIKIFDEYSGKGYGNEAMSKLIDIADKGGYTITLTPSDSFGSSIPKLKKWYKSMGFVENKGKNKDFEISDSMYRSPNVSEIDLSVGGPGLKPGGGRKFPEENPEGGHSLNLSVDDGPHQFPYEEKF